MMLIFQGRRFVQAPFTNEDEIDALVAKHAESIFGPSTIYLPKTKVFTSERAGTIPDGFALDPEAKRWYIVEAELSTHRVWDHIAPQVTKQIVASTQPETITHVEEVAIQLLKTMEDEKAKFTDLGIPELDIRKHLATILSTKPIVGIPIDAVSTDLREWAVSIKNDVRLWIVRKYVEYGNPKNVIYELPEESRPDLDTATAGEGRDQPARYDVSIADLINAGILRPGSTLRWTHKPRGSSSKHVYMATVGSSGGLEVQGQTFSSPSFAALSAAQSAGADRIAVNGWTAWRDENGILIADLRDRYLASRSTGVE